MCRADRVKTKDNSPFPNDFNNHVSSEVYNYGFNAYKYIVAFKFQNECFDPEDKIEYLTTNYLAIIICYKQLKIYERNFQLLDEDKTNVYFTSAKIVIKMRPRLGKYDKAI